VRALSLHSNVGVFLTAAVGGDGSLLVPTILDCRKDFRFWDTSIASKFDSFCKGLRYPYCSPAPYFD
jgi:hypothetical protein